MTKVLFVGCGVTSSLCSSILRKEFPLLNMAVWDKSRGPGGRMSTIKSPHDSHMMLDIGAQYISATPDYATTHQSYYQELKERKILTPLLGLMEGMKTSDGMKHYVAPAGISSLIQNFLQNSNCEIRFNHHIQNISSEGEKWKVVTENGHSDTFDIVILTLPVPQIFSLSGDFKDTLEPSVLERLSSVKFSSRFALGLFYAEGAAVSLSGGGFCAQYVTADPIIRFICIDNVKREKGDAAPSVVVHTSVPFGKANVDKDTKEVESIILKSLQKLHPSWPDPLCVQCHKFKFSQVSTSYPGLPGVIEISRGLFAGGDSFTHSNFDGCIESAEAIAQAVLPRVNV